MIFDRNPWGTASIEAQNPRKTRSVESCP